MLKLTDVVVPVDTELERGRDKHCAATTEECHHMVVMLMSDNALFTSLPVVQDHKVDFALQLEAPLTHIRAHH